MPSNIPADTRSAQNAHNSADAYWRRNLKILSVLLTLWAIVGLGCGVLVADWLNRYWLFGYPLGFWFAQQGSIVAFVLIILCYCLLMNRLDAQHHHAARPTSDEPATRAANSQPRVTDPKGPPE